MQDFRADTSNNNASFACLYISTPAQTSIGLAGTFVKIAGTTTEITSTADITVGTNRFTYTGAKTRRFRLDAVISATTVNTNTTLAWRFAKNGVTVLSSEQKRRIESNNDLGNFSISCCPELANGDYVEMWIANETDTANLTAQRMNMNIEAIA